MATRFILSMPFLVYAPATEPASAGLAVPVGHEGGGVGADGAADVEEFDDIQSLVAGFEFGDVGLSAAEFAGEGALAQIRVLAGLCEKGEEEVVLVALEYFE